METEEIEAGDLEEGDLVLIDGEPSVITDTERSRPGKHGTAKVTISAEGLRDGEERSLTQPADGTVETPTVETERNPLIMVGGDPHFDPTIVGVAEGGNVVWLWDDDEPHRIVAEDDAVASDREEGEGYTFEHAFESTGAHAYRCEEHGARGIVLVRDE